jgi:hypothetical protein
MIGPLRQRVTSRVSRCGLMTVRVCGTVFFTVFVLALALVPATTRVVGVMLTSTTRGSTPSSLYKLVQAPEGTKRARLPYSHIAVLFFITQFQFVKSPNHTVGWLGPGLRGPPVPPTMSHISQMSHVTGCRTGLSLILLHKIGILHFFHSRLHVLHYFSQAPPPTNAAPKSASGYRYCYACFIAHLHLHISRTGSSAMALRV